MATPVDDFFPLVHSGNPAGLDYQGFLDAAGMMGLEPHRLRFLMTEFWGEPPGGWPHYTIYGRKHLSSKEIRQAVRHLRSQGAPVYGDGYYHCLVHPDCEYDMMGDSEIVNVFQSTSSLSGFPSTAAVPAVYGVKFFRVIEPTRPLAGHVVEIVTHSSVARRDSDLYSTFMYAPV